jgi:hypothetical protein
MMKQLLAALACLTIVCFGLTFADVASNIKTLTGKHTRVVWSQSTGSSTSRYCTAANNRLLGIDTDDGQGVRTIRGTLDSYSKPLITPKGPGSSIPISSPAWSPSSTGTAPAWRS